MNEADTGVERASIPFSFDFERKQLLFLEVKYPPQALP